ncbi:MAG: hypothetical protein IIV90_05230, partial [Oscillospiraceae bacterium]|nr:hypothetical protein [Oscillospiraceae bacterium]
IPESEEYDTLAGYLIAEYGGIPHEGEEIRSGGYLMRVRHGAHSQLQLRRPQAGAYGADHEAGGDLCALHYGHRYGGIPAGAGAAAGYV